MEPPVPGDAAAREQFSAARRAHLATTGPGGPHLVPICFALAGDVLYSAVDRKPKRVPIERLARIRNIQTNPDVALLVDQYDEDWDKLWYILVRGHGEILPAGEEQTEALHQLRNKYAQYSSAQLLPV